jgi:hypothetical protein
VYAYFLYPFISCWAPQLIPQLGCSKQSCNNHGYAGIFLIYWFTLLQIWLVWQGHKVSLFLMFWGNSTLILIVVALFPQTMYPGSFFLTSSFEFVVCFFDHCHSDWGKMEFWFAFFMTKDGSHLYFFQELSKSYSCLLDYLFFRYLIFRVLCIFYLLIPYPLNSWKSFTPILWLSLDSVIVSFDVKKLFNLMQSHLSKLALISWAIGVLFRK